MTREIEELQEWAVDSKVEHSNLDKLLKILRQRVLPGLPKSSKTLLKTSEGKYTIIEMQDANGETGKFVYFGIKKYLEKCIDIAIHRNENIELIVNVDGMPITISGIKSMWVTLCKVHYTNDIYQPFPISVYYGCCKPASAQLY